MGFIVLRLMSSLLLLNGALKLTKREKAIIVSIGTGTAFVKTEKNKIEHLGGTGIGGGTFISLCNSLTGRTDLKNIIEVSSKGELGKVDLTIGDITKYEIPTLPKDITASNLAKLDKSSKDADVILGIINMIIETIGMMGVFITRKEDIKEIVAIGTFTRLPQTKLIFR